VPLFTSKNKEPSSGRFCKQATCFAKPSDHSESRADVPCLSALTGLDCFPESFRKPTNAPPPRIGGQPKPKGGGRPNVRKPWTAKGHVHQISPNAKCLLRKEIKQAKQHYFDSVIERMEENWRTLGTPAWIGARKQSRNISPITEVDGSPASIERKFEILHVHFAPEVQNGSVPHANLHYHCHCDYNARPNIHFHPK
jgi:hypothetical protein